MIRRKLKRATGWALLAGWVLFGASCSSVPKQTPEMAISAAMDIIEILCPPETLVGDCTARARRWLPLEPNPYVPADAGSD